MSESNRDSGAWVVMVAVCAVLLAGGAFFAYTSVRSARMAAMAAEARAMAAMQEAKMHEALARSSAELQAQIRDQQATSRSEDVQRIITSKLSDQQADWNSGNLEEFMKVYWKSNDLTFASGGKVTRGWQATLDGYKQKYPTKEKLGTLTFGNLEFQQLDNSVMLVLGTWHLERGDDSVGGNFSLIWRKIENDWVIVHDHTSALRP